MGPNHLITIDGPAGAGKSTVARALARSLGCRYLDSGAFYRAVAWQAMRLGLEVGNAHQLAALLDAFAPEAGEDGGGFYLRVDGHTLRRELRSPEVTREASRLAKIPAVRHRITQLLRRLAASGRWVAEGRDLGSVVFPQAEVKFYLDAALTVRAARRQREQQEESGGEDLKQTLAEMAARDAQDRSRSEAPLTVPPGAVVIDTTGMQPEEVVARCLAEVRRQLEPAGEK